MLNHKCNKHLFNDKCNNPSSAQTDSALPQEWPDQTHPVAVFPDGSKKQILQITMKDIEMATAASMQGGKAVLFEGYKAADRTRVWMAFRKDRNPLLIIYQDNQGVPQQVCQFNLARMKSSNESTKAGSDIDLGNSISFSHSSSEQLSGLIFHVPIAESLVQSRDPRFRA